MAFSQAAVSVGTTATALVTADSDGEAVTVRNVGADDVFLGNASVTTANGFTLSADEVISFDMEGGAQLYGRVASGTVEVRVLRHRA